MDGLFYRNKSVFPTDAEKNASEIISNIFADIEKCGYSRQKPFIIGAVEDRIKEKKVYRGRWESNPLLREKPCLRSGSWLYQRYTSPMQRYNIFLKRQPLGQNIIVFYRNDQQYGIVVMIISSLVLNSMDYYTFRREDSGYVLQVECLKH